MGGRVENESSPSKIWGQVESKLKVMLKEKFSSEIYEPFMVIKNGDERAIRYDRILDDIRDLTGKILTIIDASIINEAQNKSIKDLIKKEFSTILNHYENICFYGKRG